MEEVFEKIATNTDVNRFKFSVPVAALEYLPYLGEGRHAVHIPVRDNTERVHNIRCSIRRKGHRKPVFGSGWRGFVRSKDVRVGDQIILEKEEDNAAAVPYKIVVKREKKHFGFYYWAEV